MKSKRHILLVEDDVVDVIAVERAFRELNIDNKLDIACNGIEALRFLEAQKNEKPCLILLDLNMHIMNGVEFLEILKNDERLRSIPVVVVTISTDKRDKINCFTLGAAGYMMKPPEFSGFIKMMQIINQYWSMSEISE